MINTSQRMRISRRRFLTQSSLALGAIAGTDALLTGCTGSILTPDDANVLTVMYGVGELSPDEVTGFEKLNPSITVNQLEYDVSRLNAMLAAGIPPDFIRTSGAPEMPNIIARDLALDLTHYFEHSTALNATVLQPVNAVYRWDHTSKVQGQGARYGMAKDWSQDAMLWYNKKVFDKAGVPYPSSTEPMSFAQLLDVAKRITVRQGDRIQVYGLDAGWGFFMQGHLLQMLAQEGKALFSHDFSEASFTTPEVRAILQWYVDWAQARVGPSPLDPDASGAEVLFGNERLGMALYGYWFGGSVVADPSSLQDHVGFAPAPQWGSHRISACMSGTGAWIPKDARHPDLAWKFMEYFMSGLPAHDRAQSGWGIPSLKPLVSEMPQRLPYQKQAFQVQQQEFPYLSILQFSSYANFNGIEAAITQYIEPVIRGETSLDTACQQLNDAVNKLLRNGKGLAG